MVGHVAFVQLHGVAVEGMVVSCGVVGTVGLVQVSGGGEERHVREPAKSCDYTC